MQRGEAEQRAETTQSYTELELISTVVFVFFFSHQLVKALPSPIFFLYLWPEVLT